MRRIYLLVIFSLTLPAQASTMKTLAALPAEHPLEPQKAYPTILAAPRAAPSFPFLDTLWHEALNKTGRFRLVPPSLVEIHAQRPDSWEYLAKEFNMDGYIRLLLEHTDDTTIFTARLFSKNREIIASETLQIPTQELKENPQERIFQELWTLACSLTNRLPLDATVLSIEGSHVTLSAGLQGGLSVGQELPLERVTLKTRHPLLGTWQDFTRLQIATVRILHTGNFVSVGKVENLLRTQKIHPGDGIKIPTAPHRKFFLETLSTPSQEKLPQLTNLSPPKEKISPANTPLQEKVPTQHTQEKSQDPFFFSHFLFDGGADYETITSPSSQRYRTKPHGFLPLTRLGVAAYSDTKDPILFLRLHLATAQLGKATATSYATHLGPLWRIHPPKKILPIEHLDGGLLLSFQGLGAQGSPLGGYDVMTLRLHSSTQGHLPSFKSPTWLPQTLIWNFSLEAGLPLLGRIGENDRRLPIQSGSLLLLSAALKTPKGWGVRLFYDTLHMEGSKKSSSSQRFGLLATYAYSL